VTEAEDAGPLQEGATGPLPERVRAKVVALASDALGRMPTDDLPTSLMRVAAFAPARRAKLAGSQIASVLEVDEPFRNRVAADVRQQVPDLTESVDAGVVPAAADPVDLAAVAYLLRPAGWDGLVAAAHASLTHDAGPSAQAVTRQLDQLRRQLESATESLKESRGRHREQLAALKVENADLRHKLGDARTRARAAETSASEAATAADVLRAAASNATNRHDAEVRRLRARVEELEREVAAVRRAGRVERGTGALRARLLLDTLLDTAQGLRRELALPAVEGSPADGVEAHVAEQGSRARSGHSSLAADDPAMLEQLLALPRAHMIVDGYNVTKTAWPELSLERQRDRLLAGVAPLVARSGAEVTVVFDAAGSTDRPPVNRPRGVRVLYSPAGVIADDVIRELVAAEPQGRPLVVVSSDNQVARDVVLAGARSVAAGALTRLLGAG
jgi:predicted RNA-binding protein with PIN domain